MYIRSARSTSMWAGRALSPVAYSGTAAPSIEAMALSLVTILWFGVRYALLPSSPNILGRALHHRSEVARFGMIEW
jgi:hypothetical protein